MTLKEFAALKAGDKIANYMAYSVGEVVAVDEKGVQVRWHGAGRRPEHEAPREGVTRHYSVASTIWMHWSLETDAALDSATMQA